MGIKTAIIVDPFGSMSETPEQQIEKCKKEYKERFGLNLIAHTPRSASEIKPGTKLVLFDFGGMTFGNSLMGDQSRYMVQWAMDHPNSLVVIISTFTFNHGIRHAIEDLMEYAIPWDFNQPKGSKHKTPLHNMVVEQYDEDYIPKWFLDAVGAKPSEIETSTLAPPDDKEILETERLLGGITLPKLKFFNPNKKFVPFMVKNFAKHAIFDIGAGCGHIANLLHETKKFSHVFGMDIFTRDEMEFPVHKADARTFPFPPKSVILFCRPCHGFFVEDTITTALARKAKQIVYIGLEKNVLSDLNEFYKKFKKVASNVGEDGEHIWVMK